MYYKSTYNTPTKDQIKRFKLISEWFLNDSNTFVPKKVRNKISLERLQEDKKNGGRNLTPIENIFKASKTRILIKSLEENEKNKPWAILLKELLNCIFKNKPPNISSTYQTRYN